MSASKKKRMGDILLARKLIDHTQLESALDSQERWGRRLGETLVSLGFISEEKLVATLGEHLGIPTVNMDKIEPDSRALAMLPRDFCQKNSVVPIRFEKVGAREYLVVAVSDPTNVEALDDIRFLSQTPSKTELAGFTSISRFIRKNLVGEEHGGVTLSGITVEDKSVIVRSGEEELVDFGTEVDPESKNRIQTAENPWEKRFILLLKVLYRKSLITKEDVQSILKENF